MPLYDFKCPCGKVFEVFRSFMKGMREKLVAVGQLPLGSPQLL